MMSNPLTWAGVAFFVSLCSLAVSAVTVAITVRTIRERSPAPQEVVSRMLELEAEWASTLDLLTRHQKKQSKRERDALKSLEQAPEAPTPGLPLDKAALRLLARQRGLG